MKYIGSMKIIVKEIKGRQEDFTMGETLGKGTVQRHRSKKKLEFNWKVIEHCPYPPSNHHTNRSRMRKQWIAGERAERHKLSLRRST